MRSRRRRRQSGSSPATESDDCAAESHDGARSTDTIDTSAECDVEEVASERPVPDIDGDTAAAAEYAARFGSRPMHEAVLEVVCRAAALMGKLCGDNGAFQDGYKDASTARLGAEAYELVTQYMRVLFGESNTPKMHALAYYLADELMRRGNLIEADTSVNEMLHKILKAFFVNTNKHPTSFQVQMMRCEMTLFQIVAEDLKDEEAQEAKDGDVASAAKSGNGGQEEQGDADADEASECSSGGIRDDGGCTDSGEEGDVDSDVEGGDPRRAKEDDLAAASADEAQEGGRRQRVRGQHTTLDRVVAADESLTGLSALLGKSGGTRLIVTNSEDIDASLPWRAATVRQHVRAAKVLYKKPWYDDVYFHQGGAAGTTQLGRARLIVRAVAGERSLFFVVQLMEPALPRAGCVLTAFGCSRMKWRMDPSTGYPTLAVVPIAHIRRLEHVVPDFEALCDRVGLMATHASLPDTPRERDLQRFFTNAFFPWTSASITDAPSRQRHVARTAA